VRDLKQRIDQFVQRYNADAAPFKWVATVDSILRKIERIAKRISATGH
jgi:putative transposase